MKRNTLRYFEKVANVYEFLIACLLLIVIAVKVFELIFGLMEVPIVIINMNFERILSMAFILVIGVELTKMLFKHTPETVLDVLLFTIARQMVMYHENTMDLLIGVIAIGGLFAAKKFLTDRNSDKNQTSK
jgi:hypothetical protein